MGSRGCFNAEELQRKQAAAGHAADDSGHGCRRALETTLGGRASKCKRLTPPPRRLVRPNVVAASPESSSAHSRRPEIRVLPST